MNLSPDDHLKALDLANEAIRDGAGSLTGVEIIRLARAYSDAHPDTTRIDFLASQTEARIDKEETGKVRLTWDGGIQEYRDLRAAIDAAKANAT